MRGDERERGSGNEREGERDMRETPAERARGAVTAAAFRLIINIVIHPVIQI